MGGAAILPGEEVEEEVEDMIVVMEEDPILVGGEGRMVDMAVAAAAEEEAIDVRAVEMDIRPRRTVAGRIMEEEEEAVVDMAVIVEVRRVVISFRFCSSRFPASNTHPMSRHLSILTQKAVVGMEVAVTEAVALLVAMR